MVQHKPSYQAIIILIVILTTRLQLAIGVHGAIGVDYGLNGDNLPSPEQAVALLMSKGIARVRMYEARQEITKAFANSGIELLLGIPNELVPKVAANLAEAFNWVTQNVVSFPKSGISAIIVGNEWLLDPAHDPSLLLPAMLNVYTVLTTTRLLSLDLSSIKVSTSHAFNVLGISFPPSSAQFDASVLSVLSPILTFLEQTGSFFMVNVFPYFAYVGDSNVSLDFALFEAKEPVQDPKTGLNYTNLFDLQLDAVYAALDGYAAGALTGKSLGVVNGVRAANYSMQVERRGTAKRRRPHVIVGESGWPSGSGSSGSVPHSSATFRPLTPADHAGVMSRANDLAPDVISRGEKDVYGVDFQGETSATNGSAAKTNSRDVITRAVDLMKRAADVRRAGPGGRAGSVVAASASGPCGFSARVCGAATVENAGRYNQNLIRHVLQAKGTPANPTTPIYAFIFALFNEDLKAPGPEQHYGLFFPNATPVYPITFH